MNTFQILCRKRLQITPNCLGFLSMSAILLLMVSGCSSQNSASKLKSKIPPENPEDVNSPTPLNTTPTKLKLILNSPKSLRVKQGDLIVKGQLLVDRSAARQTVVARRQKVQQEVALLAATEDIQITPPNTAAADAQIKQAQERVRLAESAIQDYLSKSPYTDVARQTLPLPAEEQQLAQLQFAKTSAQAQLEQAIAQRNSLQTAQQARQQVQANSSSKKKQLLNELKTIEAQLQALQDILSPHDAIVQTVDWQKQDKTGTTVELALAVHSLADPISPLPQTTGDPLLSVPGNEPVPGNPPTLPNPSQPFPSIPVNPSNVPNPLVPANAP